MKSTIESKENCLFWYVKLEELINEFNKKCPKKYFKPPPSEKKRVVIKSIFMKKKFLRRLYNEKIIKLINMANKTSNDKN